MIAQQSRGQCKTLTAEPCVRNVSSAEESVGPRLECRIRRFRKTTTAAATANEEASPLSSPRESWRCARAASECVGAA